MSDNALGLRQSMLLALQLARKNRSLFIDAMDDPMRRRIAFDVVERNCRERFAEGEDGVKLYLQLLGYVQSAKVEQVRHLTVEGLSAYMGIQVIGGFVGCVSAGYVLDALGRRRGLALFALGSALSAWAYVVLPLGAAWLVFAIGFPLGFFGSGIFSGLAVYLAELYPTELRGAGQGFGYNIGRGIGAVGPAAIGVAAARVGLSDALALAATSYVLCLVALLFLPETRGKHLTG